MKMRIKYFLLMTMLSLRNIIQCYHLISFYLINLNKIELKKGENYEQKKIQYNRPKLSHNINITYDNLIVIYK